MKNNLPKWNFSKPEDWKHQVKNNLPTKELRRMLGNKMDLLAYSDYPNRLGEKKLTKYGEAFVIDLDKKYRLSYLVYFSIRTIEIIRVGDHPDVGI